MKTINDKSIFIDSHCHVNSFEDSDFGYFSELFAAVDIFEMRPGDLDLATMNNFRSRGIYVSSGVHPLDVYRFDSIESIDAMLDSMINSVDLIGETGIDVFKASNLDDQMESLRIHIKYAKFYNKPIIIHCRGNVDVNLLLNELRGTKFVFHCFGYDLLVAEKVISYGGMVSFSGIVTFPNALDLQNAAASIDINYLLCETDSPFLAPVPLRGRRNKPIYVSYVYEHVTKLRQMQLNDFAEQVKNNFIKFVG